MRSPPRSTAWATSAAIALTALLFGLAHASIYRLAPTFLLGIAFGLLVWRSGPRAPVRRTGPRAPGRRQQLLSVAGLTGINGAQNNNSAMYSGAAYTFR